MAGLRQWKTICFLVIVFSGLIIGQEKDARQCDESDYNSEMWKDPITLIKCHGYPAEKHTVTTSDGFVLTLHRIPYGWNESQPTQSRPVVFLQHGLLASSTNWITNMRNESLGYLLADHGYDVWMGNIRGNTYSRKNLHLEPSEDAFWEWSFDEMAAIDLPSMVDYVLTVTNQKNLSYVGHSQGTTIGFIAFSNNQELAEKINLFVALAPVANISHIENSTFVPEFTPEIIYNMLWYHEVLPHSDIWNKVGENVEDFCNNHWFGSSTIGRWVLYPMFYIVSKVAPSLPEPVAKIASKLPPPSEVCKFAFKMCGFNEENINPERLQAYYTQFPAGTSAQNIVHWAQMLQDEKFQMYDYGSPAGNMEKYNQTTPPTYYVENMNVPVALYYGGKDQLADLTDVGSLKRQLKEVVEDRKLPDYNHVDFIWDIHAAGVLYSSVIEELKMYSN